VITHFFKFKCTIYFPARRPEIAFALEELLPQWHLLPAVREKVIKIR